jgi:hypothetical protein
MKAYTDIEQSRKLAEILPIESADMVLQFTHKENNEYIPGYAVSRNYIEAYNDMLLLPTMDKDTISKLIQPCWSLAALLDILPAECECMSLEYINYGSNHKKYFMSYTGGENTEDYDNPIDACYEMIIKLHKMNLL